MKGFLAVLLFLTITLVMFSNEVQPPDALSHQIASELRSLAELR